MAQCSMSTAGNASRASVPAAASAQAGHTTLLCATEPLDIGGAARLLERVRPLLPSCSCLLLDLQQAEFIDSSGVRMLLQLLHELESPGRELRLIVRPGSRVERTLRLLQLLERFHTFPHLESACAGLDSSPVSSTVH